MRKIYCFTNIAPLYRSSLWNKLLSANNFRIQFHFGKSKKSGIKEIDFNSDEFKTNKVGLHQVNNYFIFNRFLIWQSGVITTCVKEEIFSAIFIGDFLVLSTWIAVLICKIRKIKTVFWSHGMYGNETGLKKIIRLTFYKLPDYHLLYERRAKKIMIENGFNPEKIHIVFNSLDYQRMVGYRDNYKSKNLELAKYFSNPSLPYIIFTGRLTKVKKIHLLLGALENLLKKGRKVNLLIVGDGPEKEKLIEYTEKHEIKSNIHFFGPCYSEEKLSVMISQAELCVSPGNVGLTAIHSLSYGTPVCTHNNVYNQMPEMEAINEGVTGILFKENNVKSLSEAIENWLYFNIRDRRIIRKECYKIIDLYYNPDYQLKVLGNLLDGGNPLI